MSPNNTQFQTCLKHSALSPQADERHEPDGGPEEGKSEGLFAGGRLDERGAAGHVCVDQVHAGIVNEDTGGDGVDDAEGDEGCGRVGLEGGVDGNAYGDTEGSRETVSGNNEEGLDWNEG